MKALAQELLRHFGFEVIRKAPNPFAVQQTAIRCKEPVIFDVGAHIGVVTNLYRSMFPLSSIYSFEPFPPSFEQLKINTAPHRHRTTIHNLALSDKPGMSLFNANTSSATNSLLPTDGSARIYWNQDSLNTERSMQVNTTSIDCFCQEHSIPKIDILKLDIQGAEFRALKGAERMLSQQAISLIYSEVITAPTYRGQHKFHEYLSLLDSFGYDLIDFYHPTRNRTQLLQVDLLFSSATSKQHLQAA